LIHCKNLCKCHNIPTPSTTIKEKKINKGRENSYIYKMVEKSILLTFEFKLKSVGIAASEGCL
jgi:hypothetical protein